MIDIDNYTTERQQFIRSIPDPQPVRQDPDDSIWWWMIAIVLLFVLVMLVASLPKYM